MALSLDATIFREYDIRGIVGKTLPVEGMRLIGRAFGTVVRRAGGRTVAVGYDGRLSSPELEGILVEGLREAGVDVTRIGCGPSPMLYFATHHLGTDAGMMVTGSHNPPDYNGIKMVLMNKPFFGDAIQSLAALVRSGDFESGQGAVVATDIREAYVSRLVQDTQGNKPLRVAWDPGNGACGVLLRTLCERLPGHHVMINEAVDGNFPAHHPDPTVEENLEQLKAAVAQHQCDLGIAFDGDGDRIGVIDAKGRVIWGDQLLVILASDVLARRPGATIIADVKSSQVFFDEITRLGGKALMSRTGHSLIKTMMAETGAALAGEMSGHIFFADGYYGFDDAPYAAVRLLSTLSRANKPLTALRDAMPQLVNTPELRIDCAEERKFRVVEEVRARLRDQPGVTVHAIDGVRVTTADGWWLLRSSNTQPVLVGRCEAADAAALQRLKDALAEQLRLSEVDASAVA
ncbi:MAG: phosphomannomutase/phosphoglucomutase [Defluviicoccus sp.]|nr:phosphomannomutase/phosphoglucomutase [Defluviicoccus sp.]